MRNDTVVEIENTGLRHSVSGKIGSGARRSRNTNSTSSVSPPMPSATIVGEPQSNCEPPHSASSSKEVTPPTSSAAPE